MTTSSFTRHTRTDSTNVGRSRRPIPRLFEATATAAVVFSGLFAGMLLAVAVLESSMRGLAAAVYTQVRLIELDRLGGLATILLVPAIIATAALAWSAFVRRGAGRWLTLTALLLLLTVFAISVVINVPINTAQQGWSLAAPPSDWSGVRDRWQLAHVARTCTAALAFMLLAVHRFTSPRASRQTATGDRQETNMRWVTEHSAFGDGHEVLYLVYSQLAGDDPRAISEPLTDHLTFLSQLAREGLLVTGGPLETPHGANSGNGIYVLRAPSLPAAEAVAARDPLHARGIRVARVHRWNRKKDWSALPDRESLPS